MMIKKGLLLLVIFSLFIMSCQDIVFSDLLKEQEKEQSVTEDIDIPQGYGAFYLNVNDEIISRAILPGKSSINSYILEFTETSNNTKLDLIEISALDEPVFIPPGTYKLNVKAFTDFSGNNPAAQGTLESFTISLGLNSPVSITLRAAPISEGGEGSFAWSIKVPAGTSFNESFITVRKYSDESIDILNTSNLQPDSDSVINGQTTLEAGYYVFLLYLDKGAGSAPVSLRQILHIYKDLESVFQITLSADNFTLPDPLNGSGTTIDPYLVKNLDDLKAVGRGNTNTVMGDYRVGRYLDWTLNKHYKMTDNITLTSNWTRIDGTSETTGFTGSFDGDGYTITGLTINTTTTHQGMFGFISSSGIVKNIGLINVNITGTTSVGSVTGQNAGRIENCYVTGIVSSNNVATNAYVAGIVGNNSASTSVIINCYAAVKITASGGNIGGIAGNNNAGSTIENCIALNESIVTTSTSSSIGRIIGSTSTSGIRNNNFSWRGMNIETGGTYSPDYADIGKDAPHILIANLKASVNNWPSAFRSDPWVWDGVNMPSLNNSAALPWPAYLVDIGTDSNNPIPIRNETDLKKIGTYKDGWTRDAYYLLMNDINLAQVWTRIGGDSPQTGFLGTFDGNGYTISGLTNAQSSPVNQGMFGYISAGGKVRNLGLVNINIYGTGTIGSIAGQNDGIIDNCYATGSVTGTGTLVGGIAGNNKGAITNCFTAVTVTANDYIGGIVGSTSSGTLSNCIALNDNVIGTGSSMSIGRVSSGASAGLNNNYAWSDMTVTTGSTLPNKTITGKDGADLTTTQIKLQISWTAAGFKFGTDSTSPWVWADGKMPRLWNSAAQNWPEHLEDVGVQGAGTADNPFKISNGTQLQQMGRGTGDFSAYESDAYYELTRDIVLSGTNNWTPIEEFSGNFNGNGYSIIGLSIVLTSNDYDDDDYDDIGMFQNIGTTGIVENLGLVNCNVSTLSTYVGAITAYNEGIIRNCFIAGGQITADSCVGGLVAWNDGKIINCVVLMNSISVSDSSHVGRIVGTSPNDGICTDNYARSSMLVNNTQVTADVGANTINGADITAADWGSINWWRTTLGFPANIWPESRLPLTWTP